MPTRGPGSGSGGGGLGKQEAGGESRPSLVEYTHPGSVGFWGTGRRRYLVRTTSHSLSHPSSATWQIKWHENCWAEHSAWRASEEAFHCWLEPRQLQVHRKRCGTIALACAFFQLHPWLLSCNPEMCVRLERGRQPPWHLGTDTVGEVKDGVQARGEGSPLGVWGRAAEFAGTTFRHAHLPGFSDQAQLQTLLSSWPHESIVYRDQAPHCDQRWQRLE